MCKDTKSIFVKDGSSGQVEMSENNCQILLHDEGDNDKI